MYQSVIETCSNKWNEVFISLSKMIVHACEEMTKKGCFCLLFENKIFKTPNIFVYCAQFGF